MPASMVELALLGFSPAWRRRLLRRVVQQLPGCAPSPSSAEWVTKTQRQRRYEAPAVARRPFRFSRVPDTQPPTPIPEVPPARHPAGKTTWPVEDFLPPSDAKKFRSGWLRWYGAQLVRSWSRPSIKTSVGQFEPYWHVPSSVLPGWAQGVPMDTSDPDHCFQRPVAIFPSVSAGVDPCLCVVLFRPAFQSRDRQLLCRRCFESEGQTVLGSRQ